MPRRGDRVNGDPHRRAPYSKGCRRLHVVADDRRGVPDVARGSGAAGGSQQWRSWLVADQQEPRTGMAFRRNFQPLDHHLWCAITTHGVYRQRVVRNQGREATPLRGVRREQRPSERLPQAQLHDHHSNHNGCTRDVAASIRRNSGTRRCLMRQCLVTPTHATTGRRRLSLGNGHGTAPLRSGDAL